MATASPSRARPVLERAELLRILDLPSAEFRAARSKMSDAERAELLRVWEEESAEAIADYNRYVEERGLPLAKYRTF